MTVKQKAILYASKYFDDGLFQEDLADIVAIKTESQKKVPIEELQKYYDDKIIPILSKLGFTCKIMKDSITNNNVFLFAERFENDEFKTILTYGHGDVVLGQKNSWESGLSPYKLTVKNNRFYGRGTADNKGQHLINIKALESLLSTNKKLGFNCKILFEIKTS